MGYQEHGTIEWRRAARIDVLVRHVPQVARDTEELGEAPDLFAGVVGVIAYTGDNSDSFDQKASCERRQRADGLAYSGSALIDSQISRSGRSRMLPNE